MLHSVDGLAEFEQSLILQRTNQGCAMAKADGKLFGRKLTLTVHQQRQE